MRFQCTFINHRSRLASRIGLVFVRLFAQVSHFSTTFHTVYKALSTGAAFHG
ncbi:hypothetical protein BDR05DRAFT_63450 [Suillus weaverae]|nr:hypothetical protein BDR05DRAFT_63450 [Suillus weaverae]